LGYLFTVPTYKYEITATILITNILLIWRVQFMQSAKGYASDKRLVTTDLARLVFFSSLKNFIQ
jgi:hypothetical protein